MWQHCSSIGNMTTAAITQTLVKETMDAGSFMMLVPFPTLPVPGFGYPYHIRQTDFLDAYRKSARILGASRIKNASLDINPGPSF